EMTLYKRIGGYDVLAAVVDEFLRTLSSDPRMLRFSASYESRKRNRQLTLDYLCAATGGPTFYLGRDMKTAHAGLRITADEWTMSLDYLQRALIKFKVAEPESRDLVALFSGLKDQVVER
ncbi:MAG: group 1 truncated hemoglobin, partial [Candidatus Binataceae bacterium]